MNKKIVKISVIITIMLLIAGVFSIQYGPNNLKKSLLEKGVVQYFLGTYHSLRKLPDVVFFPYWFLPSKLPNLYLKVDPQDLITLNNSLPKDPFKGTLLAENRVFVDAYLHWPQHDYTGEVEIRYRGTNANHWNSKKRSMRINFPKENRPSGMKGLNLVIPVDRGYIIEILNAYRAKKLGVKTPEMSLVRLDINGERGVYIAFESWSENWLERAGLPPEGNLFGINDREEQEDFSIFSKEGLYQWKSYNFEDETHFEELETLIEILENSDNDTFKKLIKNLVDLEKIYAWDVINTLAASTHQGDLNNTTLFFNNATGKFEPIMWDVGIKNRTEKELLNTNSLTSRILSIPEFKKQRDLLLESYTSNQENLKDDLDFYDALFKNSRRDFFKDNEKLYNNFSYLLTIYKNRKLLINNFELAKILTNEYSYQPKQNLGKNELQFEGSFLNLAESVYDINEFLAKNSQFYKINDNTIGLSGSQFFAKTTIMPQNIEIYITKGSSLYFIKDTSLISYSPIKALGTETSPIIITAENKNESWGSLLIVGTKDKLSILNNVEMSYGSGTKINGITSTGMLASHDADIEVKNSIFHHSFDDDAINIKYGTATIVTSKFYTTFSDAIDSDYNTGLIGENTFMPPIGIGAEEKGGDAIDISFSNVMIRNNTIFGCGDKGISIGERSSPILESNNISNCQIGIAVKDLSEATINGGTISNNDVGIALYQKKEFFGGAKATTSNITMENNKKNIEKDALSAIIEN